VYPLKGQLLVLHTRPVPIKANIWDSGNDYVVPKRDGRVIVGATEEPDVYDRRTTLGGMAELSRVALGLVPKLAESSFVGAWGGLRPATPSGSPILGPVEGLDGLLLATGHFRNGVLLSAITGEIISALALEESPSVDISPFLYDQLEDVIPYRQ
jgi:glycine oxidase